MISLIVNDTNQRLDVSPDTPLLWVLRDNLGLTGTKYGCGMALSAAAGKSVLTIEGLSRDGSHPLQQAWIAEEVPQCGYCQSGQIMAAAVLLRENPRPSNADIDSAMSGNICRCG